MSQYQSEFNAPPMAPPQYGGEIPAQPSSWPTVIGVLLIVLACIGLLINLCNGVMAAFVPAIMSAAGNGCPSRSVARRIRVLPAHPRSPR
jgi:hypothetical protein